MGLLYPFSVSLNTKSVSISIILPEAGLITTCADAIEEYKNIKHPISIDFRMSVLFIYTLVYKMM
ncbi:hypothetical protein [Aquimarina spongiae]|uniref:hypothetical protein n=1 Tax=Aquimarina spongiae TaxID=570521 RepID=UPI0009322248|nr:hypothetical protein [Aquimarina spongiae]